MVGTQYFPASEVQQQMAVEYPDVTSQQEPPHSEGGSPEGWSRDEGTSVILEYVLPGVTFVYIQSPSYDGRVIPLGRDPSTRSGPHFTTLFLSLHKVWSLHSVT